MEVVGAIGGFVVASMTCVGVFWSVVFGPRSLVDWMAARKGSGETSKVKVQQPSKASRVAEHRPQQPSPPVRSRYFQWKVVTERFIFECWDQFHIQDWTVDGPSLAALAGFALRLFLFCAPTLAVLALFCIGIGLVVPYGAWLLPLGFVLLVGFLTAFVGEFFLIGVIGLIAFFYAVLPEETFKYPE